MKNSSFHISRLIAACVATLLLMGCGSTRIFYADFQSDTVGAPPNPNPPGPPTEDRIASSAGPTAPTPMLEVVNDPTLSSKSLRFANTGPVVRDVYFISKGISSSATRIYAEWRGSLNIDSFLPIGSAPIDVWLGDAHFAPIAALQFKNGGVFVNTTAAGFQRIGSYEPFVSHSVLISVNKADKSWNVSFLQGSNSASRNGLPVLDASALATEKPTLYMAYLDPTFFGTGAITFMMPKG